MAKRKAEILAQVTPLIIGPLNAEAATGFPWRWCRDTWKAIGGRFVGHGRKQGIPAQAFLETLQKGTEFTESVLGVAGQAEDAAAIVRRQLGLRLKLKGEP